MCLMPKNVSHMIHQARSARNHGVAGLLTLISMTKVSMTVSIFESFLLHPEFAIVALFVSFFLRDMHHPARSGIQREEW